MTEKSINKVSAFLLGAAFTIALAAILAVWQYTEVKAHTTGSAFEAGVIQ